MSRFSPCLPPRPEAVPLRGVPRGSEAAMRSANICAKRSTKASNGCEDLLSPSEHWIASELIRILAPLQQVHRLGLLTQRDVHGGGVVRRDVALGGERRQSVEHPQRVAAPIGNGISVPQRCKHVGVVLALQGEGLLELSDGPGQASPLLQAETQAPVGDVEIWIELGDLL